MKEKLLLFLIKVFSLILILKVLIINAQTNPTPHNLSVSDFSFTSLATGVTTYPTSMQGWQTFADNINTAETVPPAGDYALSSSAPGIYNSVANGFSFQSTGSGATRRVGSIALALNTTGRDNISVSWTAQDLNAGTRRQTNLALQYRIGNTGNFTTLAGSTYSTNTTSQNSAQGFTITLPYACIDEPLVQLRWIYYESGTASTTRDPLRLDEISVTSNAMACSQRPSNIVVNSVANTTAQVSWTASSPVPASGYDYYYSTSNTPPTSATTPTGNTSSTSLNITGLAVNTTYYFWVRSRCGGGSQQSKWVGPVSFRTYCTPNFNNTNKGRLYINSFQFVGVLNTTVANTSTWASGYQNFTSFTPIAEQPQGTAINILASSGSNRVPRLNGTWKAWVDWNKDGDFNDVGEEVYNMISFTTPSVTFGFIIPVGQAEGNYTLRIGTFSDQGNNFNACSTASGYGEMEDYTFKVVTDCPAKVLNVNNVNPFDGERCGAGSVRLSATGNESAVSYNWYDSIYGGTLLGSGNIYNTPSISSTTTYYVTAVSSTGCETAFRYPVEARVDPNPTVAFSTNKPSICGEDDPTLLVTASGDKYQDVIFEKFDSGLGVFTNEVNGAYTNSIGFWQRRNSPYIPQIAEGYEGLSPAMSSGYFGEGFAMINTDISRGSSAQSILNRLTSNNLDVSGFLNLKVDFDLFNFTIASNFTEGYTLIEYSLNGGTNWNTLDQFIGTRGNPLKWEKFSYNIPGTNFTSTDFKLRFSVYSYAGPFSGGVSGFIEGITTVDNVRIYGFKTITTPFSWSSPTVSLYDAATCSTPVGSTLASTVCVKPSATELEDVNWALNASATFSNGCPAIGNFTVNNDTKTWRQPGIIDWNQGAQWRPSTVPTINKCVIVRTPVELPTNTNGSHGLARSVIVKPGGSLIIQPKSSLTIQNHIKNETAASDVLVESDANLIQFNDAAANSGNITVQRNSKMKRLDYTYWGSPVSGQKLRSFSPATLNTRFYVYNEANDYFDGIFVKNTYPTDGMYPTPTLSLTPVQPEASYDFEKAKGYAVRSPNNFTTSVSDFMGNFVGTPNNGVIKININKSLNTVIGGNTYVHGINLISNPYPSNIDLDKFFVANPSLEKVARFWTNINPNPAMQGSGYPNGGFINNYAFYNIVGGLPAPGPACEASPSKCSPTPTNIVKVGQGFLVHVASSVAPGTNNIPITFNNSIRSATNSGSFFNGKIANATKDRYWLELKTPLDFVTPLLVGYVKGSTNAYDEDYDVELNVIGADSFYTILDNKKLGIQGRKYPVNTEDVVSLGAIFHETGMYMISLTNKEGVFANGQEIYLRDNLLGVVANLSQGAYSFSAQAGEVNNRFEILYNYRSLGTDTIDKAGFTVYKEGNDFVIKANETIKAIKIYDASGKLIYKFNANSKEHRVDATKYQSGVYMIDITTSSKSYNKKIIK